MMGLEEIKQANEDPLAHAISRLPGWEARTFVPIKDWPEYYDVYIEGVWQGSRRIR